MSKVDEIYKFIGLGVAIIVVVAIILKAFSYQVKIIEGMTSSSTDKANISVAVTNNTDQISDTLLVSKYRANYEDTIVQLEKTIGLTMVSEVVNNAEVISKDATSVESIKAIANINALSKFRDTLNQSMIILDKTT